MHGNEASGRESCFTMARQLAFTQDPAILDMLSKITVLIMPSSNPDGRALNQRGNSTGQDLNRDHALIEQAETKAQAQLIRDYTPDVSDRQPRGRQRGPADPLRASPERLRAALQRGQVDGDRVDVRRRSQSGWWMGPYSTGGDSHEGILRNTAALKNGVSMLGEARAAAGTTRPAEGATERAPEREPQGVRAPVGELGRHAVLRLPLDRSWRVNKASAAYQSGDSHHPHGAARLLPVAARRRSVGANPNDQPDVDTPLASRILDPGPCGYFIPQAEYDMPRTSIRGPYADSRPASVADRVWRSTASRS